MRTPLRFSVLLIALAGCSSDAVGPPVDPSFGVSGKSASKCFDLAQRLDASNLRTAERSAETISRGVTTIYFGAGWNQRAHAHNPAIKRTVDPGTGTVTWHSAITHPFIQYTPTDEAAHAEVHAFGRIGPVGGPSLSKLVCSS